jgi:hypothetical protein
MSLFKSKPRRVADLTAELYSDTDAELECEIEFEAYSDGTYLLQIDFSHVTMPLHKRVELLVEGRRVARFEPGPLRTRYRRTEVDGPLSLMPERGQHVALLYQGKTLVQGQLVRD